MSISAHVKLSGSVGIKRAAQIHSEVCKALGSGKVVTFDFDENTGIDASVLQLLLAVQREADDRDKDFHLLNVPPAVVKQIENCGAASLLTIHDSASTSTDNACG